MSSGGDDHPGQRQDIYAMRPVYLGNLRMAYNPDDISKIFENPTINNNGNEAPFPVERVDIKRGYCFVFFKDMSMDDRERLKHYVNSIHEASIPGVSDSLRADFAKGDGRVKRKEEERRKTMEPSETLFVVNFIETTRVQDLEMLFEKYGRVVRVDMKRNYAFVQFETIEEATKAKEATDGGKLDQAVLTVEYVASRKSSNTNSYDDRRPAGGRGAGYYNQDRRGPRRDSGYSSRGPPPRYADGYSRDRRPPPSFQPRDDGNYSGGYDPRGPPPRRRSRSRSRSPPRRYENDYRYDPPNPQGSRGYDDSRYYDRRERGYR